MKECSDVRALIIVTATCKYSIKEAQSNIKSF